MNHNYGFGRVLFFLQITTKRWILTTRLRRCVWLASFMKGQNRKTDTSGDVTKEMNTKNTFPTKKLVFLEIHMVHLDSQPDALWTPQLHAVTHHRHSGSLQTHIFFSWFAVRKTPSNLLVNYGNCQLSFDYETVKTHMCWGLNSHCFPLVGLVPNSRVYIPMKYGFLYWT